jgi:hypothetical protein
MVKVWVKKEKTSLFSDDDSFTEEEVSEQIQENQSGSDGED